MSENEDIADWLIRLTEQDSDLWFGLRIPPNLISRTPAVSGLLSPIFNLNFGDIMSALSVDLETKERGRIWLLPPYNYSLRRVGNELSVAVGTVHKWRQELKDEGLLLEGEVTTNDSYTADQIFSFVIETASMSEHQLAAYCREKGLYVEQIKKWKAISIQAHTPNSESKHRQDSLRRADKKKIQALEKELARKEKALAETAALLVLREKYNALWDVSEED